MDWRDILDQADEAARDGDFDLALGLCNRAALASEEARYFAGFLRGDILLEVGDARGALSAFDSVADPQIEDPELDCARGIALFELAMLPEAENALGSALSAAPDLAEAFYLLGLIDELRGGDSADGLFRQARLLDPERYPPVQHMSHEAFDTLVKKALADLPSRVKTAIENIPVLVEELPTLEELTAASPTLSPATLGVFIGPPPSKISVLDPAAEQQPVILLYKRNLERAFTDPARLREEVRLTVIHEVGHALGLSEEALWDRGLQ